jgi:GDP-L-fucose synthase
MEHHRASDIGEFVNIGTGREISIRDLAILIAKILGYRGRLAFDSSKPDGAPRKLLDVSRMQKLGWRAKTSLRDGISFVYQSYLDSLAKSSEKLGAGAGSR